MAVPVTPAAPGRPSSLWRNRDFVLLWSGQVVSVLGTRITTVAYPLLVLALTHSPVQAGIVAFAGTLPYLLFQLPAGGFVDRWNRKTAMVVCDCCRGLAMGSLGVALLVGHATVGQIVAVAFVEGTCFTVFGLAESAALPQVVPVDQLPTALAQNEARSRGAGIAGSSLGGILIGLGQALPFVVDAVSYVVSVVSLLFVRARFQEERREPTGRLTAAIMEGLVWVWNQPFLRGVAGLIAASNLIFQALTLAVIVRAQDLGASPTLVGVVIALIGVGGLVGSIVSPWLQRLLPPIAIVIGVNWAWAVLLPLMAVAPLPILLGALFGVMSLLGATWNVVMGTYQLTLTPDRLRGRVQSVTKLVAWGAIPLGPLVAGFLLEALGSRTAILCLAAAMGLVALVATLTPAVRRAPSLGAVAADSGA